jgi:hypothetical protein
MDFSHALIDSGARYAALDIVRTVVVPHGGGSLFDLVIFDPWRSPYEDPIVVPTRIPNYLESSSRFNRGRGSRDPSGRSPKAQVIKHLSRLMGGSPDDTGGVVATAIDEFAVSRPFTTVVVGAPDFEQTGWPSVICPNGTVGTIGVRAIDPRGDKVLTTANHVVDGVAGLSVCGQSVSVVDSNLVVDVATLSDPGGVQLRVPCCVCGPANVPGYAAPASFRGAGSGPGTISTVVTGTDPAIAADLRHTAVRICTRPDTVGGDSGAALLDAQDRLVGFCSERTGMAAPIGMSTWVWAEQVFNITDLHL